MPKRKTSVIDALCVAYLAAQGKKQQDIGAILGLNQSAVSRLYNKVGKAYVEITMKFREDKVDSSTLERIRRSTSRYHLEDRLKTLAQETGRPGPVLHSIFLPKSSDETHRKDGHDTHEGGPDHTDQLRLFGEQAAPVVYNLLKNVGKTVGVAWGSTLWQTTQQLRTFVEGPWRQEFPVEFVPLCGDPMVDSVKAQRYADRTSSRIASELSKIVNGDKPRPLWLGLVPAFIPRTFKGSERKAIDRFIDLGPHYGRIFGPRNGRKRAARPLVEDLDMILTAAGSSKYPVGFGQGPLLQLEDDAAKKLEDSICGDIGGVLVPKGDRSQTKTARGHRLVKELTDLWTGLRIEHLEHCAWQAFAEDGGHGKRPGVTLLGYRRELAGVVCEAVRRGLVNHLIVGSPLETALEEMLG